MQFYVFPDFDGSFSKEDKTLFAQDLIRSGFMEDHINRNYPKGVGYPNTNPLVQDAWQTNRTFDYVPAKMDMPIPTEELLKNSLCDQNDAYK